MKKHIVIIFILAVVFLSGCHKEVTHPDTGTPSMFELDIPPDFDWKTIRPVDVWINGIEDSSTRTHTLTIKSVNGGVYYKKKHSVRDDLHIRLEVPSDIESLFLSYGNLHTELAIQNDVAAYTFTSSGLKSASFLAEYTDSDQDGVYDVDDEYPYDIHRAYNMNYFGDAPVSLSFEDNWPSLGDFDFNDLVLDASLKIVTNANDQMVEMYVRLVVKAIGAKFVNGFGFQLKSIPPQAIMEVSGMLLTKDVISLNSNGTEAGQSTATIIAFDNPFLLLPHPGNGTGVNTMKKASFVQPRELLIKISFMDEGISGNGQPMYYSEFTMQDEAFNPFIFVDGNRRREIHLPGYVHTDLAKEAMFSTINDATNPAAGRYYTSVNHLPWAILIPQVFDYPIEKAQIPAAHLKFAQWAQSGGVVYKNWYKNIPGYRDFTQIY
ncbi:MAG: LruC domain-containing protein [Bacteroidales bacterium]